MPGGRPRKYKNVKTLQKAIDDYFQTEDKVTITGLALHLGFATRQSLLNNEGYSDEFLDTIKKAKTRVENYYEKALMGNHATGAIFALKNFDWNDKKEIEHSGELGHKVIEWKPAK